MMFTQKSDKIPIMKKSNKTFMSLLPESYYEKIPLFLAISKRDIEDVTRIVNSGVNINTEYKFGREICTPLNFAVKLCYPEMVTLLINHGANIYEKDNNITEHVQNMKKIISLFENINIATSALFDAIKNNQPDKIKQILQNGICVDVRNNIGATPLMAATYYGFIDIVKLLIEKDANINAVTNSGATALMDAADRGHKDIAELLLNNGAFIYIIASYGKKEHTTPLDLARDKGHKDIVTLLIHHQSLNRNIEINTIEKLLKFIDQKRDLTSIDSQGESPLTRAIEFNQADIVKWLISKGVDINASVFQGNPLQRAVENNNLEMVKLLIQLGADVNTLVRIGASTCFGGEGKVSTPLAIAVEKEYIDIVHLLVNSNADVNAEVTIGAPWFAKAKHTILTIAKNKNKEIEEFLLMHGAKELNGSKELSNQSNTLSNSTRQQIHTSSAFTFRESNTEFTSGNLGSNIDIDMDMDID